MAHSLKASNIISLADFKARASEVLNSQKRDGEAVVITQNGKAAAVLVSAEAYDALVSAAAFSQALERGLLDARDGRLVEQSELAAEMARRYGGA